MNKVIFLFLFFVISCVDKSITKPPEHKELSVEEIKAKLLGKNFREKMEARKQLNKLSKKDRLILMEKLIIEGDSAGRMLAVSELEKLLPDEKAIQLLQTVAEKDKDSDVRQRAAEILKNFKSKANSKSSE